jgi:hypothetical protein
VNRIETARGALFPRELPKVAVPAQKVEGIIDQSAPPAGGEFGLQFGEISPAFMDDDHLPVDDGLTGNIESSSMTRMPPASAAYPIQKSLLSHCLMYRIKLVK